MCKTKFVSCIPAFIFIIIGCYLLPRPEISFQALCYLLGIVFMGYGVIKLICYFAKDIYQLAFQFDFAMGLFSLTMGLLIFYFVQPISTIFSTVIGIIIFIDAVLKIQTTLDAKKFGLEKWWLILILAIATALAACFLIVKPMGTIYTILHFLGLNFILDGCLNLWIVLYTVKVV
ncbi:DUF308 domain-containing protein [Anaerotignum neopropionicum]|nr:DUF308 domain-containing protein [Anaerotignum neopropionicum]